MSGGRTDFSRRTATFSLAAQTLSTPRREPAKAAGPCGGVAAAADDWSYYCLGAKHGCVLAQHAQDVSSGFYDSLTDCESSARRGEGGGQRRV